MLATWPTELLAPLQEGFQRAKAEGRLRTPGDSGPPRVRRRFSAGYSVPLTVIMSRSELGRFDRFVNEEIEDGSLPFLMPDPMTDGWALLDSDGNPLLTDEGQPLLITATWLCLFDQLPTPAPYAAVDWRVSMSITVLP
jgi:hypothetical protein